MQKIISLLGISQTGKAGAEILRLQLQGCRQLYFRENISLLWSETFPSLPKEGQKAAAQWPEAGLRRKGAFAAAGDWQEQPRSIASARAAASQPSRR